MPPWRDPRTAWPRSADRYQSRRDVLCDGLEAAGWAIEKPKATMFVWARIRIATRSRCGNTGDRRRSVSLAFCKKLLAEAKVAVSPGIGFGQYGDDHVRFGLIENEHRTRQAVRGIRDMLRRRRPRALKVSRLNKRRGEWSR